MKKITLLFLIALPLFGANAMPPKASNQTSEEKQSKKKSAKRPAQQKAAPITQSSYGLQKGKNFSETFQEIMNQSPEPILKLPKMDVEHEETEGSRRFVKFFNRGCAPKKEKSEVRQWHLKSLEAIDHFIKHSTTVKLDVDGRNIVPLEKTVNIALARLTFAYPSGDPCVQNIKSFFISGWPANQKNPKDKTEPKKFNLDILEALSRSLIDGIEDLDESYKSYSLRFITMDFEKGNQKVIENGSDEHNRMFGPFFGQLITLVTEEEQKEEEERVVGSIRAQMHKKLTKQSTVKSYPSITNKLYFHSEQALRIALKSKIKTMLKGKVSPPNFITVDIASRWDCCWCCGDMLSLSAQLRKLHPQIPVFFRMSGRKRYFDRPFNEIHPNCSLGKDREKFNCYDPQVCATAASTVPTSGDAAGANTRRVKDPDSEVPYMPRIVHMVQDDLELFLPEEGAA